MGRRRNSNRRRRGSGGFLYKLLSMLVICGAIIAALTLFFRVDAVLVTGQQRYTEEEVQEASGVALGDNLFLLNKYSVANRIVSALPYIEELRVNRKLPDSLIIEVKECGWPLAVRQEGSAWLISKDGKIVEQKNATAALGCGIIDGCELLAPSVGTYIAFSSDYAVQKSSLLSLMGALDEAGVMDQVNAIHLGDPTTLTMEYGGRFTVQLSYEADYQRKLRALEMILEESGAIQENMRGTFDMRRDDGKIFLIQDGGR